MNERYRDDLRRWVEDGHDAVALDEIYSRRTPSRRAGVGKLPLAIGVMIVGAMLASLISISRGSDSSVTADATPDEGGFPVARMEDVPDDFPVLDYIAELTAQNDGSLKAQFTLPSGRTVDLSFPSDEVTSTTVRYAANLVTDAPKRHDLSVSPGDADAAALNECEAYNARCEIVREPLANGMTLVTAVVKEGPVIDSVHVVETAPGYFLMTLAAAPNAEARRIVDFIEEHVSPTVSVPYVLALKGAEIERNGLFLTVQTTRGPAQVSIFEGCDPPQGFGGDWRCLGTVQVQARSPDTLESMPELAQSIDLVS